MDDIQRNFASNLRREREKRGMSLDQTAKLCGVSKSMLAQIEKGTTSPTISTIWKISNGLKVPFTTLLSESDGDVEIIDHAAMPPYLESDGAYRNYPLFRFSRERPFEVYYIELDPGAVLRAEPHPFGTQEIVTAFSGELELAVNGAVYRVPDGSAIRFKADHPHVYSNPGTVLTRLSMVISYA